MHWGNRESVCLGDPSLSIFVSEEVGLHRHSLPNTIFRAFMKSFRRSAFFSRHSFSVLLFSYTSLCLIYSPLPPSFFFLSSTWCPPPHRTIYYYSVNVQLYHTSVYACCGHYLSEPTYRCNWVYCIHVPGHDPITFSFRSFSFLIGWGFYGPII